MLDFVLPTGEVAGFAVTCDPDAPSISICRRRSDGSEEVCWTDRCGSGDDAEALCAWLQTDEAQLRLFGRMALRLGKEIAGRVIRAAAADAAAERREMEEAEADLERRESEIKLWKSGPRATRPSLGLQRGCDQTPFWQMRFDARWERDRVADWLMHQADRYAEFVSLQMTNGSLQLEREILAGMRNDEAAAKRRGIATGGRRPLRFWRGE